MFNAFKSIIKEGLRDRLDDVRADLPTKEDLPWKKSAWTNRLTPYRRAQLHERRKEELARKRRRRRKVPLPSSPLDKE